MAESDENPVVISTCSSDNNLPFSQRVALAVSEREEKQKEYAAVKLAEAKKIRDTVDKFVDDIMCDATTKYIRSVHRSRPEHKRKVVELFTFNYNNPRSEIKNDRIQAHDEKGDYSTKYILENKWKRLVDKYLPDDNNTLEERIQERVNNELNGGVDPETQNPLLISVFTTKKPDSTFKNGILLSRDGIKYR